MQLRNFGIGLIACTILVGGTARAAESYYLVIPGIPGESQAARYPGAIDVLSFSLGFNRGVCSALTVMKSLDASSPPLTAAAMTGQFFPAIRLHGLTAGERQSVFLTVTLHNSLITGIQTSASSERPTESVSIQPASVEVTYVQQTPTGIGSPVTQRVDCAKVK